MEWLYLRASPAARDSSKIEPIPVGSRRSGWPHRSFLVSMVLPALDIYVLFNGFALIAICRYTMVSRVGTSGINLQVFSTRVVESYAIVIG